MGNDTEQTRDGKVRVSRERKARGGGGDEGPYSHCETVACAYQLTAGYTVVWIEGLLGVCSPKRMHRDQDALVQRSANVFACPFCRTLDNGRNGFDWYEDDLYMPERDVLVVGSLLCCGASACQEKAQHMGMALVAEYLSIHEEERLCLQCLRAQDKLRIDNPRAPFKKCSGCRVAYYCGTACQKADWPKHAAACRHAAAAALEFERVYAC